MNAKDIQMRRTSDHPKTRAFPGDKKRVKPQYRPTLAKLSATVRDITRTRRSLARTLAATNPSDSPRQMQLNQAILGQRRRQEAVARYVDLLTS